MNAKTVLILVLLAGLAALGAWFVAFRPASTAQQSGSQEADSLLAPAIRGSADSIARIEIEQNDDRLELERRDGGWVVASLGGYPAEADRVRGLVTTLSELRILENKTALPENHARLGVQWPDDGTGADDPGAARPTLVRLTGADGTAVAEILLGKTEFVGTEAVQFARLLGDDQSYLVSSRIDTPMAGTRWVNARFIELPRESVRRVTITHADGETVTVSRAAAEDDFAVEGVPAGMEPISEGLANRVGNALAFVNFIDVRSADEPPSEQGAAATARFETFEGLVLTLAVAAEEDAAEGNPFEDGAWVQVTTEGEVSDDTIERLPGWSFRLPASTVDSLTRRQSDLLQDIDTGEAGPAAPDVGVPELLRPPGDG
jgi:hypothetical protein